MAELFDPANTEAPRYPKTPEGEREQAFDVHHQEFVAIPGVLGCAIQRTVCHVTNVLVAKDPEKTTKPPLVLHDHFALIWTIDEQEDIDAVIETIRTNVAPFGFGDEHVAYRKGKALPVHTYGMRVR